LTRSQIQVSIDIDRIFKTAVDFLRFVTTLFEVISQSESHIYHSALQLVPPSSMVRELYGHQSCSAMSKVVNGITALGDSCMASVKLKDPNGVWSPCGRFIATWSKVSTVGVRNSTTLEVVSTFKLPVDYSGWWYGSVTFSLDGCLLACCYSR